MLFRKAEKEIRDFCLAKEKKALLVTGARQVGKTFLIRWVGTKLYSSFVEINFLDSRAARNLFNGALDTDNFLLRLSALSDVTLVPGETLIFFDEVQECPEIVTAIKFLVEEGSYQFILSGSLLGVDLKDIRSVPVGYMDVIQMMPLDIEEFAIANGVAGHILDALRDAFWDRTPVDSLVHDEMMELFRLYLIIGGMPAVVQEYLDTNNLKKVVRQQESILTMYKRDIAKYDGDNKLYLEEIFDLIPNELNAKNKRFILKDLNENFKFSRYRNSFIWLWDAGVALPVYCVEEPKIPLLLSKSTNLFKLFLSDVGLLASMYMDDIQVKVLNQEMAINFGSIYENVAAQELAAHGFDLYYFNSKRQGELDFLVEQEGKVLPIEIKSGKDYARHAALTQVLANETYDIPEAFVFHNGNVSTEGKVIYYPIYMLMFLEKKRMTEDLIYRPNLEALR